jgi:hypothetical protein
MGKDKGKTMWGGKETSPFKTPFRRGIHLSFETTTLPP